MGFKSTVDSLLKMSFSISVSFFIGHLFGLFGVGSDLPLQRVYVATIAGKGENDFDFIFQANGERCW